MDVEALLAQKYQKIALLHEGNRTKLWKVQDAEGRPYVMECIHDTGMPLEELQTLTDQRLPRVYFAAEDAAEGRTYLVEEFVAGEPLDAYVQSHVMTERAFQALFLQICDALAALHEQELLHQDIKEANILVTPDGVPKLIDFDTVVEVGTSGGGRSKNGTPGYAAPEQYDAEKILLESTDIYALGVTIRDLLPPEERSYLWDIVEKCTAFDPKERYQTVEELQKDLRARRRPSKKKVVYGKMRYGFLKTAFYSAAYYVALYSLLGCLLIVPVLTGWISTGTAGLCFIVAFFIIPGLTYSLLQYQKEIEMRFVYQIRKRDLIVYEILQFTVRMFLIASALSGVYKEMMDVTRITSFASPGFWLPLVLGILWSVHDVRAIRPKLGRNLYGKFY